MNTTGERVVIDTNIFITIFKKNGKNRWMFDKILKGEWILCLTNDIFMEYWEVRESKTNPSIASNIINFLISHPHIEFVENYIRLNLIQADADDNKFCDCCFSASAKYLITIDRHFRILKKIAFPSLPVINSDDIKSIYFGN